MKDFNMHAPIASLAKELREIAPAQQISAALHLLVHELCSPLQSLIASNEALVIQDLDDDGRKAVARVHRATQRITAQLNDFEALARIQSGLTPRGVSFEVGALLEDIAALDKLRSLNGSGQLSVRIPAEPIFVRGEAQLIQQALDRLVRTVLNGVGGKAALVVDTNPSDAGVLSFVLRCDTGCPRTGGVAERLNLVHLIAGGLDGELSVSDDPPSGPTFVLRVSVQPEDPDAVPVHEL